MNGQLVFNALQTCGTAQYLPSQVSSFVAVAGLSVVNNVLMWADPQYTCYNGFLCPVVNGYPTQYCNGACFDITQYE